MMHGVPPWVWVHDVYVMQAWIMPSSWMLAVGMYGHGRREEREEVTNFFCRMRPPRVPSPSTRERTILLLYGWGYRRPGSVGYWFWNSGFGERMGL
ncbi:hypothetical protein SLA2020_101420 [Shorea laevis]